jgi:hypothetical protein
VTIGKFFRRLVGKLQCAITPAAEPQTSRVLGIPFEGLPNADKDATHTSIRMPGFVLSEVQFAAINAEVCAIRGKGLNVGELVLLTSIACQFLEHETRKSRLRRLNKIASHCEQLVPLFERWPRIHPALHQIIDDCGRIARDEELAERGRPPSSFRGKQMAYVNLLEFWRALGGDWRVSRDKSGKITGPLARFFKAVVDPAMGGHAMSLETLPDMIEKAEQIKAERVKKAG